MISDTLDFPWELLDLNGKPAVLTPNLYLVRDSRHQDPAAHPLSPNPSILLVSADPNSSKYRRLHSAGREMEAVSKALSAADCRRWRVDVLPYAKPADLERRLADRRYDVLHFIGHGEDAPSGGFLVLESGTPGDHSLLYADDLLPWLRAAGIGTVVLSCCTSAGSRTTVGTRLSEGGVPAVLGMQFPIDDQAAASFSRAFYAALALGEPVEEAAFQGRTAIQGFGLAWASPVLTSAMSTQPVSNSRVLQNLPVEDRPFIGRVLERNAIRAKLREPGARMITVTAMGGMGKTRLARQLCVDLQEEYQGVWFVPCDTLETRDEVVASIASQLGLTPDQANEEAIVYRLSQGSALLVLDCFEALLDQRSLLAEILANAPSIQLLVTSRRRLDLPQEHEFKLPPMALPKRSDRTADALELFAQAAGQASPGFVIDRRNRQSVTALVKALEAIPLAIVLAAGRLRHLTVEEILEKVLEGRRMVVLSRRSSLDRRHDNLVQVLKDSFALLTPAERETIFGLAVFRGNFSLQSVSEVIEADDALEAVSYLYDHSLLSSQVVERSTRYFMLDTVRECIEFLEDHHEIENLDLFRARHAEYFAEQARHLREAFDMGEWSQAGNRLWLDAGNYRAAVAFAVKSGDAGLLRRLASSLIRIFFEVGVRADFEAIVPGARAAAEQAKDLALLAELHGLQGENCRRDGRIAEMISHARSRAVLCRELGDAEAEADSLLEAADQAFIAGIPHVPQEMLERFEQIDEGRISISVRASALLIRARMEVAEGHTAVAEAAVSQADELMSKVEVDRQALYVWMHLSALYRELGQLDRSENIARRLIRDGLTCLHYQSVGQGLFQLASTLQEAGDWLGAAEAIALALQIPKSISKYVREQSSARWQALKALAPSSICEQAFELVAGDWKYHSNRIGTLPPKLGASALDSPITAS